MDNFKICLLFERYLYTKSFSSLKRIMLFKAVLLFALQYNNTSVTCRRLGENDNNKTPNLFDNNNNCSSDGSEDTLTNSYLPSSFGGNSGNGGKDYSDNNDTKISISRCFFQSIGSSSNNNSSTSAPIAFSSSNTKRKQQQQQKAPLSPSSSLGKSYFFIPKKDTELYKKGIREFLSQMGAAAETANLSVVCVDVTEEEETNTQCQVCLYNEVSTDRLHARQGVVLEASLRQCIHGAFKQGGRMLIEDSEFHPICYPSSPDATSNKANGGVSSTSPSHRLVTPRRPSNNYDYNLFTYNNIYNNNNHINNMMFPSIFNNIFTNNNFTPLMNNDLLVQDTYNSNIFDTSIFQHNDNNGGEEIFIQTQEII